MYRLLLSAMLIVGLSVMAVAQDAATSEDETPTEQTITVEPPTPTELTTDAGFGVKYTKERVIHLPQDSGKFFVTIFGNPADARFQDIKGWFNDVPELARLKSETHFNTISTTQADFRDRYAKNVATTPMIRVQTAAGGVVYQVSGKSIPMSGQSLSRAINTEFLRRWRQRRLERENQGNNNNRKVDVDKEDADPDDEADGDAADENMIPDTSPGTVDMISDEAILVFAGLAGIATFGGFALMQQMKRRTHKV